MKKILLLMLMLTSMTAMAQKDVTKFLGIPVDGSKAEMEQKLIEKGFVPKTYKESKSRTLSSDVRTSRIASKAVQEYDYLEGEFNGYDVYVHVVTNNDKVYRIVLYDVVGSDKANIRIRFNYLCRQFANNKRYFTLSDQSIPDGEDFSYEMATHDKIYEAVFYQKPEGYQDRLIMTDEMAEEAAREMASAQYKPVWFRIVENYGKYYIVMYYDNKYNEADGEDL